MCHSIEVGRYLLTAPGEARSALRPVPADASVAVLKWARPAYAERLRAGMGGGRLCPPPGGGFRPRPDHARRSRRNPVMIEAATSWAYVGAGLRISLELLGPEYAMEFNPLGTGLKLFLSRETASAAGGEDLVEKQNAERGLMPVIEDEPTTYGDVHENRHFVEAFRRGEMPAESFADGLAVLHMLMALYRSAELGRTVRFNEEDLTDYVPPVARR